ncbi:MAG: molybdopterin-binding protein [Deltaproteobacteria bacterium]|nr:molybdopterin-binding protein [Deltaproteobacteria bacterium]
MTDDVIIIAIGRELVNGRTLDTNSNYIAKSITKLGARVRGIHITDDVRTEIVGAVRTALAMKPALVITTGGLGPTADDMTLGSVAGALGRRLVKNKEAMSMLGKRYNALYDKGLLHTKGLNEGRTKMAVMPAGARPLENPVGTAPAVVMHKAHTVIFCLPGVPAEAKAVFDTHVADWVRRHLSKGYWLERSVLTDSYDESVLGALLDRVSASFPDVYMKSSPAGFLKEKSLEVFFTSVGKDRASAEKRIAGAIDMVNRLMHK